MMIKGKIKKLDPERIPVYEIVVEDGDETGISLISLVQDPAMMIKGMAFSNQSSMSFKEVSADKQIIVGPALIPNMRIYREDEKYGKYYVMFSKETIAKMVEKFNKFGSNRRINIDHSNQMVDAFIIEDWITEDLVYDKSRKYGFEVPVGTYMIMVKIEDTDFWNEEVRGNGKFGFSIEGMLGQQLVNLVKQEATIDDLTLEDLFKIFEIGVPHYTADGKLYEGPTHKDASGRLMTGAEHSEDSEYLYHEGELKDMKFSDIFVTDSSNVDRLKYFEEKRELVIKFNDGSYYTYSDIDADEFNAIVEGDAVCRTSGQNEFGEWEIGKTPSVGAAVWKFLIDKGNLGTEGGSFY